MKMTNSLLNAYLWYMKCPPKWKDSAMQGLKDTLTKGFTSNEATVRGEMYEAVVNAALLRKETFTGVQEPLNALHGMKQQVWINPLDIRARYKNHAFLFTFKGKMDLVGMPKGMEDTFPLGEPVIADIKTTQAAAIKPERYTDSFQHIIYCLAQKIPYFMYYIARFESITQTTPVELAVLNVDLQGRMQEKENALTTAVEGLVELLHDFNLWDDYFKVFNGGNA